MAMSKNKPARAAFWAVIGMMSFQVISGAAFRDEQDRYPRVRTARVAAQPRIEALFTKAGLNYPAKEIFLRIFKLEGELELWSRNSRSDPFTLVHVYAVCASSGTLGPKRREGDLQVPEGFYAVSGFNPWSKFHLSLRVDYPNASDRILGDRRRPGGDIFIHGSCVTIGCVPLRNGPIEEVYLSAVDARDAGQSAIPVHIFPCRLDGDWLKLEREAWRRPGLLDFWRNLKEGYDFFEKSRRLPRISVDSRGKYFFD
jgi:murein L,D-transpeptidase YafK